MMRHDMIRQKPDIIYYHILSYPILSNLILSHHSLS